MEDTISTQDLKTKLKNKESINLIETLAPEAYREAHLPGAVNIPPECQERLHRVSGDSLKFL